MGEAVTFGRAPDLHQRTVTISHEIERVHQRLALARSINGALVGLIAGAAGITILLVAISMLETGSIGGVYLALLPLTALASFEAVQQISSAFEQIDSSHAAARRVFEIIDAQNEVRVVGEPFSTTQDYSIELRNVSFGYDKADPLVLEDVSFRVCSGDRLAIIGPSGSGKTTIVNLLLRFWDCRDGEVLIGGRNIAAYDADDVRRLIGMVPQNVYLFNGTIRDNLLVGKGDATDEEVSEACRRACVDDVIAALPLGYDTVVGENGHKLSGGERQRLAIARVFLKNAPILVLDEATANLDASTEKRVLHSLDRFMTERTALTISHSSSVGGLATRVISLGGRDNTLPHVPDADIAVEGGTNEHQPS
jgi:ATP-binding cassette subfamily C protein CydC